MLQAANQRPDARSGATYPIALLAIFMAFWLALAVAPLDRHDWLLENALTIIALLLLCFTYRDLRFSNFAYTALFIFMLLHTIGAHYTYAKVPYDAWCKTLTGTTLNAMLGLQRNQFDRLVHFLYGFLLFPVFWEMFAAKISARGFWRYLAPTAFIMSHAGIYEVIEWGAAEFFGGDLGVAYLGTQGDEWDAQKDMALAMLGTLLALILLLIYQALPGKRHALYR
jgi:putative membrane protein